MNDCPNQPSVVIKATISAPDIAAKQQAFMADHPDLFVMTVESMQNLLNELTNVLTVKGGFLPPGSSRFRLPIADEIIGEVAIALTIEITDVQGGAYIGAELIDTLWETMSSMANDLAEDPFSEHRREYIQELKELEIDPEVIKPYETAPICNLRDFVELKRIRASGSKSSD